MKITIFGGYGFIGTELIKQLLKDSKVKQIIIPFAGTDRRIKIGAEELPSIHNKLRFCSFNPAGESGRDAPAGNSDAADTVNGSVQAGRGNSTRSAPESVDATAHAAKVAELAKIIAGSDLVINLIGILNEYNPRNLQDLLRRAMKPNLSTMKPSQNTKTFAFTHRDLPELIAAACEKTGAHMLHISAQGASINSPSAYLVSKAQGEETIKSRQNLNWTIIRPGLVIGENAHFIKRMRRLARLSPIMPLPLAESKGQPVAIQDLLFLIAEIMSNPDNYKHAILNAVGPEELALAATVKRIARPRLILPIPALLTRPLVWPIAIACELVMSNPLITRDNIRAARSYQKVADNHLQQIKTKVKQQELLNIG